MKTAIEYPLTGSNPRFINVRNGSFSITRAFFFYLDEYSRNATQRAVGKLKTSKNKIVYSSNQGFK